MRGAPTPARDYGNDTVRGGERGGTGVAFVAAHSAILLTTSVAGTAANVFVLLAVCHQKSLRTSNNALLVNLAAVDTLRCVADCPALLAVVAAAHRRARVDARLCDAQAACFAFGCCVQLLTLACVGAERHRAVAQPFERSQRRKRVAVLIPLTWTLAFLVTVFCLLFARDSLVNARCRGSPGATSPPHDTFGIYVLLPLWAGCFGVITGFYARLFALVRAHNRKIFDKGHLFAPQKDDVHEPETGDVTAEQGGQGKSEQTQSLAKWDVQQRFAKPNLTNNDCPADLLTQQPSPPKCVSVASKGQEDNNKDLETAARPFAEQSEEKPPRFNTCASEAEAEPSNAKSSAAKGSGSLDAGSPSNVKIVAPQTEEPGRHGPSPAHMGSPDTTSVSPSESQAASSNAGEAPAVATSHRASSAAHQKEATEPTAAVKGAVCMMPSQANRERVNQRKESKMAKRAGFIIITFLLLWLPLITTILVNFTVYRISKTQIKILQDVEILSVPVACVTSLTDPIIYAAVNPQFRAEYYRIKNRVACVFSRK